MTAATRIDEAALPRLPRHVKLRFDTPRQAWIVLAPERVLLPDAIAVAILQLCDGATPVATMIDTLSREFAADRAVVASDVIELLQDLCRQGLIIL